MYTRHRFLFLVYVLVHFLSNTALLIDALTPQPIPFALGSSSFDESHSFGSDEKPLKTNLRFDFG